MDDNGERRAFSKYLFEAYENRSAEAPRILDVVFIRPYTIARVGWHTSTDVRFIGWGAAKVMRPDKWDEDVGAEKAIHRAIQHIVEQVIEWEAAAQVVSVEDLVSV